MSDPAAEISVKPASDQKNMKPCCACPETKKPRDKCIMEYGEENCYHLIAAHKACMQALGFKI
ncbi:cytochrome c oxidase copper chaperone [Salpingoeca rosetta]|uniref:Cytochrome c oxidase copper chaperone n=1 Tax=Salpingoeca rosetta (strain ATCC 50818 / BSB-021) TaxID=946362 RepID=F2UKN1_SALR5|nr:cytochrome c oxidase copper chaperone [Salpingoeca rosetta]EGD77680.1 cytochrome c oxidase copper chaperone [Salpingoeca rosetta]|eukprot:XP_004990156.1 cytochrome c oxidase copper chaperone [Salpingoeca rosetta]